MRSEFIDIRFNECNNCHDIPSCHRGFDDSIKLMCKCNAGFFKNIELAIEFWNKINNKDEDNNKYNLYVTKWSYNEMSKKLLEEILLGRKINFLINKEKDNTIINIFNVSRKAAIDISHNVINIIYNDPGKLILEKQVLEGK